jgi:hypothetical protein
VKQSLREYLGRFVRSWWAGVGVAGGALGLVASVAGLDIPAWSWRAVVGVAVVAAGFRVFDDVRRERDAARAELATRELAGAGEPEPYPFVPRLLEGRLFPSSMYPVIDSGERALVLRAGYALHADGPRLDSEAQQAFEDALASSTLESWILDETTRLGRVGAEHWWRRSKPTRSSVVTVRRPRAPTVAGDHDVEGHAVLNLHPEHTPGPTGWLLLVADVVLRPTSDKTGRAFTYESLYGASEVVVRALVDEIAPAVQPLVAAAATPYSLTLLVLPQALSLSDVVALDWHNWERAEDMDDVGGGQWFAPSADVALDTKRRQDDLRRWFGRLLADSGYSGYEGDLPKLVPLSLPRPPET